MSCKEASEKIDLSTQCSVDGEQARIATDDGDPSPDTSGSEDDAHEIMVLALRSQIRQALHDEHQQEIANVKHLYEAELQELRADIATLQQFEAKQRDREQKLQGQLWLECENTKETPGQCATLKARIIRLQDVIADMREAHAGELEAVKRERIKGREEWQEQVTTVRAWHAEAVATLQASHIEEVARLRDEHLATLHSTRAAGEKALAQAHQRLNLEMHKVKTDAAAAAEKAAERERCLQDQHEADTAAAKRRAAATVRDGCAAAAAEARSVMQRRTDTAEQAAATARAAEERALGALERERHDNRKHQGLLQERLKAAQVKVALERRLHKERLAELAGEARQMRTDMGAIAADCRGVHGALAQVVRENSELRSHLDAERVISMALSQGCDSAAC